MAHFAVLPLHQPSNRKVLIPRSGIFAALFFSTAISVLTFAQAPGTGSTMVPIPGVGHDYIQALSETVDPASGSVSLRIAVPIPKGRGLSLPFSFAYDSNGVVNPPSWTSYQTGLASLGGWSYTIPASAADLKTFNPPDFPQDTCEYYTNFRFADSSGARRGLGLLKINTPSSQCGTSPATQSGGDLDFRATLTGGILAADANGTVYSLPGGGGGLASKVEDRNGNVINISGSGTETDTLGRVVLSVSGFGTTGNTVTVAGLGASYQLTWETLSVDFPVDSSLVYNGSDYECSFQASPPGPMSEPVIQSIQLPNLKSYSFKHGTDDPNNSNPYGLISQITYPTGAWIKYGWMINPQSAGGVFPNLQGQAGQCYWRWGKPALQSRTVSFDGVNPALKQTFQYSMSWGSTGNSTSDLWNTKQTIVTTQDMVRGTSFTTTYLYAPTTISGEPAPVYKYGGFTADPQIPVEQTVTYQDVGGANLETVNKTWYNAEQLQSEQDTFGGVTSQKTYTYGTPGGQLVEVDEYDFGASSPTRKTVTNHQPFGTTPIYTNGPSIFNKPCQTIVYDNTSGSPVRMAETDYYYDNGSTGTVCGTAGTPSVSAVSNLVAGTHDETNYGPSSTKPRGNMTQKTAYSSTGTSPTTTYTFDETGQVLSMTDPCGNSTCSEMSGAAHTTTFSYADSYTVLSGGSNVSYTSPNGNTNAYLTQRTNPLGQTEQFTYDFNTGQLTASKDENDINANRPGTTYVYNDPFARPTQVNYSDGGQTQAAYNDSPYNSSLTSPTPSVTTTQAISSTLNKVSTVGFDGMGHTVETILSSDPQGSTYTATSYDGNARPYRVYNPTRCSSITTNCDNETTWGVTTYTYDALGRTTQVAEPDVPSRVLTSYSGNQTTVTDEANNQRTDTSDAFGRLTAVSEAPGVSGLKFTTQYQYDALNNLICAVQKGTDTTAFTTCGAASTTWRPRSFVYDSLSRLTSAINPESGTIAYAYDANSNLSSKTAPSPNQTPTGTKTVVTNYTYDALNRLTGKSYTDSYTANPATASVSYGYDGVALSCPEPVGFSGSSATNGIGRRTSMCFSAGSKSWQYDPMGRMYTENDRFLGLVPPLYEYNTSTNSAGVSSISTNTDYRYDLNGDLATVFYPGQGIPTIEFFTTENGAGRITTAGDSINNVFVEGTYTPDGQLACATIGATSPYGGSPIFNTYNNRLQPVLISASTASGVAILNLTYNFNLGNGTTGSDNGNVIQIANGKDSNRTQNFLYDPLNRIWQAYTSGPNWGETYSPNTYAAGTAFSAANAGIDAWGNLTNRSPVTGKTNYEPLSCAPASTQNQLNTCFPNGYDAAGNLIKNGTTTYTYDAENRLIETGGDSYVYDGDGQRVEKCTEGATAGTCASNATGLLYWLHAVSGGTLAESDLGGNWTAAYGLIHGQIIDRVDLPANVVHYYFHDHLHSTNIVTDGSGNILNESDYYPYGGEMVITDTDSNRYKFTGKERDAESGLDYFGARYNASTMGRFMTPDSPSYSNHKNPQSWNLYAYALNNPVSFRDADGHKIDCVNNATQCQADAAAATGNAQAASQVTTQTTTTQHSFLGLFHWTTTETQIAITGDVNAFRALSPNASKLADLVQSKDTISVSYDQYAKPSFWANGIPLNGGSLSFTPSQGYGAQAFIDPTRSGAVYDPDAVAQGIPQANTGEEFGHEVLGHIWGEMFGGAPAGTRANMRDSIAGEDAVRALDPTRGQKGLESHHNYNEMPPDPPKQ